MPVVEFLQSASSQVQKWIWLSSFGRLLINLWSSWLALNAESSYGVAGPDFRLLSCLIRKLGLLRWRFDVYLQSSRKHQQRGGKLQRSVHRRKILAKHFTVLQASTNDTGNILVSRPAAFVTITFAGALLAVSGEITTNLLGGKITTWLVVVIISRSGSRMLWSALFVLVAAPGGTGATATWWWSSWCLLFIKNWLSCFFFERYASNKKKRDNPIVVVLCNSCFCRC